MFVDTDVVGVEARQFAHARLRQPLLVLRIQPFQCGVVGREQEQHHVNWSGRWAAPVPVFGRALVDIAENARPMCVHHTVDELEREHR